MKDNAPLKSLHFLEYRVACESVSELSDVSMTAVRRQADPLVFACANPHSINVARQDADFHQALVRSDILVADGVGLTAVAKLFGKGSLPRITGTDYFQTVMRTLNDAEATLGRKARVFFFGSTPKVLELIATHLSTSHPNIALVGALSPPFGEWDDATERAMVETIKAAKPDVLWVGMTAPKQEKWVEKNRHALDVPVIGSIGAVFDFFAGTHPRAPAWACAIGLEWLVRLLKEPRRMWRRTFVSMPLFALHALKYYLLGPVRANTASNTRA